MAGRMDGRVAVIAGVGRPGQVGEAVASAFASLGSRLILLDRTAGDVEARAAELRAHGVDAAAHACDLTDDTAVAAVAASVARAHPQGVHALVCLAGGFIPGDSVGNTALETWNKLVAINLTTAFVTTHSFLPLLRRARGSIVYFASVAALPGGKVSGMAAYGAAKTGVVTLMRAVSVEERPNGVRANALAPSAIRTASNVASMGPDADYVERETVAAWVTLLCSDSSSDVNGQVIRLG